MNLDVAAAVADAVLLEGYALYPFRASAPKNRYRWAFGVLAPRAWSEAGGGDPWWLESQLLVAGSAPHVVIRLRFFQIERQTVERMTERGYEQVDRLDSAGELRFAWDEGVLREVQVQAARDEIGGGLTFPFTFDGRHTTEAVPGGRVTRERHALAGAITARMIPHGADLARLVIRVDNVTVWSESAAPRDRTMTAAFASTHLVIGVTGGELISLLDPPPHAAAAASACRSTGTYPVLAGPPGAHDVALSTPFLMCDHPHVAPESPGDLCDATEIDELLSLRTIALTDEEKRHARATDPRAAAMVERACAMTPEQLERLHGAARALVGAEMNARPHPAVGSRVRLRPRAGTDAQDLLYAGRIATIEIVRHDVDGRVLLGVTIDDDPAAELHRWYGRFHYYGTDEVEPL